MWDLSGCSTRCGVIAPGDFAGLTVERALDDPARSGGLKRTSKVADSANGGVSSEGDLLSCNKNVKCLF